MIGFRCKSNAIFFNSQAYLIKPFIVSQFLWFVWSSYWENFETRGFRSGCLVLHMLRKINLFQSPWMSQRLCSLCWGESKEAFYDSAIIYLNQSSFQELLSPGEDEFAYEHPVGCITIPCSEDTFLYLMIISRLGVWADTITNHTYIYTIFNTSWCGCILQYLSARRSFYHNLQPKHPSGDANSQARTSHLMWTKNQTGQRRGHKSFCPVHFNLLNNFWLPSNVRNHHRQQICTPVASEMPN